MRSKHGYLDAGKNPVTPIDLITIKEEPPEIFTVDQLHSLLDTASFDVLPLVAIGAFAGVRYTEMTRLNWEDINFQRGYIDVPAVVAKKQRRRLIKMEPCLRAWLAPYIGKTGKIWQNRKRRFHVDTGNMVKSLGFDWAKNGLRHSFASYHLAKFENAPALALMMGHRSPQMLFDYYREVVQPDEGERYFNLFPLGSSGQCGCDDTSRMSLKNAAAEAPLRVRMAGPNMSENLLGEKVEAKGKAGEIVPGLSRAPTQGF